jgi:hypothetical protein
MVGADLGSKAVRGAEMQKRSLADSSSSRETRKCTSCKFAGENGTPREELRSKARHPQKGRDLGHFLAPRQRLGIQP